ncbi:MAG TPA: hypothetical protein VFT43_13860 [Candidatus Polarisedimenticolia bacterium]|nr:hypothetical protein [Candidatus Polarisedimenticolia bacterium]
MPRITKDCFGTVIASLKKMKECLRCEVQRECQSINWAASEQEGAPLVIRRPHQPDPACDEAPEDGAA